jgi:predicted MFS family arabinose efflux permease
MNGIALAAGMLGAIVVTVPLEVLLRSLSWREVFHGIVALTVAASLLLYLVVPEKPMARRGASLAAQLGELAALTRDPAFWRMALCIATTQFAAVSLGTLWVATWLRDIAGYSQAEVARGLLAFNVVMLVSYLGFGRAADRLARRGQRALPLLAGGVAVSSLCLGALVLGARSGAILLWCGFFSGATAVMLIYSLFSRRYPKEMAGRVNTALNVAGFTGMFSGQWAVGLVLNLWPPTAIGYAPEAYSWALGGLWLLQAGGLAWLWRGRQLFR